MKKMLNQTTLPRKSNKGVQIAFVTACADDWGGSEELWSAGALLLAAQGFSITALKKRINRNHSKFKLLEESGIQLQELDIHAQRSIAKRALVKTWNKIARQEENHLQTAFKQFLQKAKPQLVIISQGINFDGLLYAHNCRLLNINYVVISQKAVDFYWPPPEDRPYMKKAFENALQCLFVSHHNWKLTEEQVGFRFTNASIVHNPIRTPDTIIPYPSTVEGFRLACIGRLFLIDKGQDILIRVLAQDKWKTRPIKISFIGSGPDEQGLKDLCKLLGVDNVEFTGQINDIVGAWRDFHALVMPSRSEGLPLALLEAMAAGRASIVSRAGGHEEVVEDGVTGFIGDANFHAFDAALEKAWDRRHEWQSMGEAAFHYASEHLPHSPETDFVTLITQLVYES